MSEEPESDSNVSTAIETIYSEPVAQDLARSSWWSRYVDSLVGHSVESKAVLEADCSYIVDHGIFGQVDFPDEPSRPRTRTGLVMGSVQSGKTASLLGATAMALDREVDIVVILAGTRLSLWQQTFDRLKQQLDAGPDSTQKEGQRLLFPRTPPAVPLPVATRYRMSAMRIRRALSRNQPMIVVALKNTSHLQALSRSLSASAFDAIRNAGRAVRMIVLDDEADDGSILDARVEASLDPVYGQYKQIPRSIVDLWSPPSSLPPDNLLTTYIGYTATPQANFLQEEQNPLAPRDFLVALRTPSDRGTLAERTTTYYEPRGLTSFYTGGETFYRRGKRAGLCVPTDPESSPEDRLGEALRSFFVAGAIRHYWESERLGPHGGGVARFESLEEALTRVPHPHAMLVHPSPLMDDHFRTAEDILLWAGIESRSDARLWMDENSGTFPAGLKDRMAREESKWSCWLDRFRESSRELSFEHNLEAAREIPDWEVVKRILLEEILPGSRVAVINSDPKADDRPEYQPTFDPEVGWLAPRDLSTVFVSGNVMSRGLTLEGLTTTLFLRSSDSPLADTQTQMQRWFGYRGGYIELCRLFASQEQLDFFSDYHDVDEALRSVILNHMGADGPPPRPFVLQGESFLSTGKIANLGNKPLHPGRKPSIPLINDGLTEDPNLALVHDLFLRDRSEDVIVNGSERGRLLSNSFSLAEVADLIDKLQYDEYRPGADNWQGRLWSQVEARVSAIQPTAFGKSLYRPAAAEGEWPSPVRKDCPYAISAYLRLWDACLTRSVRGLFVTGERDQLWSMVSLERKRAEAPRFWVGIRYGGGPSAGGRLTELGFDVRVSRKAVSGSRVTALWGANNPEAAPGEYRGDEYFDYYRSGVEIPEAVGLPVSWRPAGSDGQILFYVNQLEGQPHPTLAVGLCIPSGGPDQFSASIANGERMVI